MMQHTAMNNFIIKLLINLIIKICEKYFKIVIAFFHIHNLLLV